MVKVYFIVLNWNRKEDTILCLKSLDKLRVPSGFELRSVVVDNGSTDNSSKEIAKLNAPVFRLVETKKNLGFAGGNNFGIQLALEDGADWVVILNNDTLVDRNFLINFGKFIEVNKNAGLISPKIYFAPGYEFYKDRYPKALQGSVIWSAGGKMDWDNIFGKNIGIDDLDRGQFEGAREIDFATGACLVVKREVFDKIGLFDDKYFMYFEDAGFVTRSLLNGFRTFYVPKMVLWHKVAGSSAIGGDLNDYFITRNRLRFASKYASFKLKLFLLIEGCKFIFLGRKWQRRGVLDFLFGKNGKGSWK